MKWPLIQTLAPLHNLEPGTCHFLVFANRYVCRALVSGIPSESLIILTAKSTKRSCKSKVFPFIIGYSLLDIGYSTYPPHPHAYPHPHTLTSSHHSSSLNPEPSTEREFGVFVSPGQEACTVCPLSQTRIGSRRFPRTLQHAPAYWPARAPDQVLFQPAASPPQTPDHSPGRPTAGAPLDSEQCAPSRLCCA